MTEKSDKTANGASKLATIKRDEMSDSGLDEKSQYTEACSALRHYSLCVLNTRVLTIAQGFVLLSAAGYFTKERLFLLSIFISIFSLLFTQVLREIQKNYWNHFEAILGWVLKLERSDPDTNFPNGPWDAYGKQRIVRHRKIRWRIFGVNGPFGTCIIVYARYCIVSIFKPVSIDAAQACVPQDSGWFQFSV